VWNEDETRALVDAAFVDMAINLYESSLRPHAVDNFPLMKI